MKEFNKDINIVSYKIDEVNENELGLNIYKKMIEDLNSYIKIDKGYKMQTLDMFAKDSYLRDVKPDWMDYKSQDETASYSRGGTNWEVDIVSSPNNIPVKDDTFDLIFVVGSKFGFGENHNSLFEVERIEKPGGLLIASVSKYIFFKEIPQMLVASRTGLWQYIRATEINYKIIESKIETAKYFCFFRYKG